jgi:hypothetical protein
MMMYRDLKEICEISGSSFNRLYGVCGFPKQEVLVLLLLCVVCEDYYYH